MFFLNTNIYIYRSEIKNWNFDFEKNNFRIHYGLNNKQGEKMSYSINTTVPKSLENTAIQYWTGVYNGNAEQIRDALDPDVEIKAYDRMDDHNMPSVTLTGVDAVVEQSLKMSETIKSIKNFGLTFAMLKDGADQEVLAIKFQQDLIIGPSDDASEVEMFSHGLEFWKWKDVGTEGNEKIVLTAGRIFEKDELSEHVSNKDELKNMIVLNIETLSQENQAAAQWTFSNCAIL